MKQSCLTAKTASLGRTIPETSSLISKTQRELIGFIPSQDIFIILLRCMPSNTNWHCEFRELAVKIKRIYKLQLNMKYIYK